MNWLIVVVIVVLSAGFIAWGLCAMASRGSREEESRKLAHDIDKFLAELSERNHGD